MSFLRNSIWKSSKLCLYLSVYFRKYKKNTLSEDKKIVKLNKESAFERQFQKIYEEHFDRLYFFAKTIVKSEELAEDIIAEVFLNLWKRRDKFPEIREMDAYLFIAVKNQSTRMLYEEPNKLDVSLLENTARFMDKIDPEELLLEKELADALEEVVSSLPDQCQLIFNMAKNRQMKYKEIADELGITISTVRTQLSKASSIIRKFLYEKYYETDSGTSQYRNINPTAFLIALVLYASIWVVILSFQNPFDAWALLII